MIKIILLILNIFIFSCTSDEILKHQKDDFLNIYKKVWTNSSKAPSKKNQLAREEKNIKWLSKFNQPIILISSSDEKVEATLVVLGNNSEKITWVSADGISLSYDNGVLVATRGFMQDLISLNHPKIEEMFKEQTRFYIKTHRYLDGENNYEDLEFDCQIMKKSNVKLNILEYDLTTDKFTEECISGNKRYSNEYHVLSKTSIILKSKQWISPINKSFYTFNYYAFQQN